MQIYCHGDTYVPSVTHY